MKDLTDRLQQYQNNALGNSNSTFNSGLNNGSIFSPNNMQSLNLNASSALYPQQNSFSTYFQPYQLAQNSLPNSGSDVGNNGSISKAQKYVLSGNSNLFNLNQKIGNSSIFQSMSNNFQQKRKNFFNKLGYPADMSLRERGVRLIENGANLIFDTFTDKTPEYIPTTEPTNFQTSIKQMSMYPKFQSSSEYIQQSLNGNELNKQERINAYKSGKKIYINLADKEDTGFAVKDNHDGKIGEYYVEKYSPLIEKYAKENDLDANLVKAILFSEASDYHQNGANRLADLLNILPGTYSESIWPMNIQGKTWGDFQGKRYNVYNPEQNIALAVKVLKNISDSVPDKDIAKIATLWNNTGAKQISDYGARTKHYYSNKSWQKNN